MHETIYAISSGRPPAAIAVFRISGPEAFAAATALAGRLPPPRHAALRSLRNHDVVLDEALVLVFPGPNSATGEDLVELHCHGGRAVIAAVERALAAMNGLRLAEPGEFTRRALIHGRIDLAEAQGLADLLTAETEAQRRVALSAAEGSVSRAIGGWLSRASALAAQAEAALDFADEDEVDASALIADLQGGMASLASDIDHALIAPSVDRLRDGIRVVLGGPPNSGKSTLLNLLADRDAAIVSSIAGTTRDRLDVAVAYNGLPFVLTDTAGLRDETGDVIEAMGIGRAQQAIAEGDLLLWLGDEAPPTDRAIWLHAKADLPDRHICPPGRAAAVAAERADLVEGVWKLIEAHAASLIPRPDQLALDSRQRRQCRFAAEALAERWSDPLIGAELVRRAQRNIAEVLGLNATEAMLDALFGRFCIGK